MLFLLDGQIEMTYGDETYQIIESGTCIYIDSSVPHRADCLGDREAKLLVVVSQNTETENNPEIYARDSDG